MSLDSKEDQNRKGKREVKRKEKDSKLRMVLIFFAKKGNCPTFDPHVIHKREIIRIIYLGCKS